jgi:hypothetical protein
MRPYAIYEMRSPLSSRVVRRIYGGSWTYSPVARTLMLEVPVLMATAMAAERPERRFFQNTEDRMAKHGPGEE